MNIGKLINDLSYLNLGPDSEASFLLRSLIDIRVTEVIDRVVVDVHSLVKGRIEFEAL